MSGRDMSRGVSGTGRCRPTRYVGRIGTLAVALGVGGVIAALPAVAAADTGPDASAGDPTQPAAAQDHAATRGGFANRITSRSPAAPAAADPDVPTADPVPGRGATASGKRGAVQVRPAAGSAGVESGPRVNVPVPVVADGARPEPATLPAAVTVTVTQPAAAVPQIAPTAPTAEAAAAPPITAAPGSLWIPGAALLALLGGGDPNAPATAPLAWAALAVARRDPVASPVASVSAVSAPAAAADSDEETAALWDELAPALTDQVAQLIQTELADLSPIAGTVAPIVVNGFADWIFHGTVAPELDQLANDPTVLGFVAGWAAQGITGLGLPPAVGAAVGSAVASLVQNTFGGPGNAAVRAAVDTFLSTLPGSPSGWTDLQLLDQLLQGGITFGELIDNQLNTAALNGLTTLLSNPAVQQSLGSALTGAVGVLTSQLAADPDAWAQIGAALADLTAAGGVVGAVADLLADPAVAGGLAAVAGTTISAFLGQPGVSAALIDVAGQVLTAVLAGADPHAALQSALQSVQADSVIQAALGPTLAVALKALGDQSLGTTITALVTQLTSDPDLRAVVTEQLGATLGDTVLALLSPLGSGLAAVLGPVITDLLGAPDVGSLLTDAVGQILAGADPYTALQNALQSVQADPALQAALGTALSGAVNTILGNGEIRHALGDAVGLAVSSMLTDNGAAERLTTVASQVTNVAVTALLANPVVGNLVSSIVVDALGGLSGSGLTDTVIQTVLGDRALQTAVGFAIGQGLGSLLGDNVFGAIAGRLAGVAVTLVLRFGSGLVLRVIPVPAAAVEASSGDGPAAVPGWWLPTAAA